MLSSLEFRDILQSASTLIAATSVFYGIRTYKRARSTQQITAIRTAFGDSVRNITDLDGLFSERATNALGVAISDECKRAFGLLAPPDLADSFANEDNQDVLVQCVYKGYENSNIAERIEKTKHAFDALEVQLRPVAPSSANIFRAIGQYTMSLVVSAYATGHVKQIFSNEKIRIAIADGLRKQPTSERAFAELANDFAEPSTHFIRQYSSEQYQRIKSVHDAIVDNLMAKNDEELLIFFVRDRGLGIASPPSDSTKKLIDYLSIQSGEFGNMFPASTRDFLVKATSTISAKQIPSD